MRFRKSRSDAEGGFEPFEGVSRKGSRPSDKRGDLRKAHQLCAQVREVISFALAEQCEDELLERLSVVAVSPAPDTSRLMVTVALDPAGEPVEATTVIEAMKQLRGQLRHEIAAEIHRKKTPELAFELAPMWLGEGAGAPPAQ